MARNGRMWQKKETQLAKEYVQICAYLYVFIQKKGPFSNMVINVNTKKKSLVIDVDGIFF